MRPSKDDILNEIFADDDPDGLLAVKAKVAARSADQRVVDKFADINAFITANGREPEADMSKMQEYLLHSSLAGMRGNPAYWDLLAPQDLHGILRPRPEEILEPEPAPDSEPESLEDIFNDDSFDLLDDDVTGIRDLRHVPKETTMPGYIGTRKPCPDFADFVDLFEDCQRALQAGKRVMRAFKREQQIEVGNFFVLKGVMAYIAGVGEREPDANGKTNARLHCIFENGTESDMLLRSLAAELYKDGRRITAHEDRQLDNFMGLEEDDQSNGFLYVLSSLSQAPEITTYPHLYKIGFSRGAVADRIKNAANEPTYLMAGVKMEGVWECYNMKPNKLEGLLHTFFGTACLDVQVAGPDGRFYTPREWFLAPLPIIEQAVAMIVSGEIVKYRYDVGRMGVEVR
jgi:hypothetical protein